MFVGHGMVAFAIAASVATYRGWTADRALLVGVVAGMFGTLPDIDMVYALLGIIGQTEGILPTAETFWSTANVVHRSVTHSLVVGTLAATGFAGWCLPRYRPAAIAGLATLAVAVGLAGTTAALAVFATFLVGGIGIAAVASSVGLDARTVHSTALVGLLSHPFGDLLTGAPPSLLFPVEWTLVGQRVALHPDPTIHLLGAFLLELATIWVALLVLARSRGWRLLPSVRPYATLGVGYAGAVFAIPDPTLDVSWPFVGSVLAVGVLAVPVRLERETGGWLRGLVTALAAVTVAALAYAGAYLIVG